MPSRGFGVQECRFQAFCLHFQLVQGFGLEISGLGIWGLGVCKFQL